MSKTKLFAIHDKKIGFNDVYCRPSEGAAIREFGESCKYREGAQNQSPMATFPSDFALYHIGEMDMLTGIITIEVAQPKKIADATQYAENKNEQ